MWILLYLYLYVMLLSQVYGEVYSTANPAYFQINSKMTSQSIFIGDVYPEARAQSSRHPAKVCHNGCLYAPKGYAWCAKDNNPPHQWYEIDALKPIKIYGVATRGRCSSGQFVRAYKIYHSGDRVNWTPVDGGKKFSGNTDECGIKQNTFAKPIVARYIHIHPTNFNNHISMRAALLIEKDLWRDEMQNVDADPYKEARMASSCYGGICNPKANPNYSSGWLSAAVGQAWCAAKNNPPHQWYQIDLLTVQKVYGTVIRGRGAYNQFVTSYTVEYSHDGLLFHNVDGGNVFKGVPGNRQLSLIRNNFAHPIPARFIRIRPQTFHRHISMKAGVRLGGTAKSGLRTCMCSITGDPHNIDWSGRKYNYMGLGDYLIADIDGYRIESQMYSCRGKITCQREFVIVTPTGKIIDINTKNQDRVYDKNGKLLSEIPVGHEVDGLLFKKAGGKYGRYHIYGKTINMFVYSSRTVCSIQIWNKKIPATPAMKGGLCTGTMKNAANVYPGINAPGAFQKPDVNKMGNSWKLKPEDSHIISTKNLMKLGKAAVERFFNAHKAGTKQYSPASLGFAKTCCAPVKRRQAECGFAQQIYLGCIMDHRLIKTNNGGAKCQNLNFMDQLCPRRPKSLTAPGCIGDWTPFGICHIENDKCIRSRTYRITRQAAPGGYNCPVHNGQQQNEECGIDACIVTFDPNPQQRTYSAIYPHDQCANGAFNSPVGWCSPTNKYGDWTEVDMLQSARVLGISTKGRKDAAQWVTSYEAKSSNNGLEDWDPIIFAGEKRLVEGNVDQNTVKTQLFEDPIQTRYIRVYPKTFHKHMSMRFGVLIEKATKMLLQERRCISWGDPHYTDWNRRVFNYFGWDNQLLATFDNIRVETNNIGWGGQDRNNPRRPTIQQTITIVTSTKKTIEIRLDNRIYLNCKPWTAIENNVKGEVIDGLRIRTHYIPNVRRKILTINTPNGLIYIKVNNKRYIDITIAVNGNKEASHITGGLCTGRPANELTNGPNGLKGFPSISWDATPPPALPNQNAINAMGKTWDLKPGDAHVCKALAETKRLATLEKSKNAAAATPVQITAQVKTQAKECCKPIIDRQTECRIDDRIYESCLMDHETAYKKTRQMNCQNLDYLDEICKKHRGTLELSPCIGTWTDWSECKQIDGKCKKQRKYMIVRPAVHDAEACAFKNNEKQFQLCPTESCVATNNEPTVVFIPPKNQYTYSSKRNGENDGTLSSTSAAKLNNAEDQYVEIDLKHTVPVFGVVTKGNAAAEEWVQHFEVQKSSDGKVWKPIMNANNKVVFDGNEDKNTAFKNIFKSQVDAKLIRVLPYKKDWHGANSIRVGLIMNNDVAKLLNDFETSCKSGQQQSNGNNGVQLIGQFGANGQLGQLTGQTTVQFTKITKGLEDASLSERVVKHLSVPVVVGSLSVFAALVAVVVFLVARRRHNLTQVEYVSM